MPIPSFIFPAAPPVSSSAIFALDVFADKPVFQPESASFTRATTATRTNSSGLIEEVSSGIARVDWSVGGEPNTLLEPQRTNLVQYSEDFSQWQQYLVTTTPNSAISPDGTLNADKITATNVDPYLFILANVTATEHTFSFYYKGEADSIGKEARVLFWFIGTATGANLSVPFTLTGGWQRFESKVTPTGAGTLALRIDFPANNANIGDYGYLWGAQLEVGAYATSYIPTTSTSVTRNADSFTLSNVYTSGKITDAGGTWFVEIRGNVALTRDANVPNFLFISNNSSGGGLGANVLAIGNVGFTNSRMYIFKLINGAYTQLAVTTTTTIKIAIKWNGSTADVFVNGVKVVTNTAFTTTNMEFLVGNGTDVPKYINSMALYPTPLLDYQCEMLTGLKFNTYNEMAGYYNYTIQ